MSGSSESCVLPSLAFFRVLRSSESRVLPGLAFSRLRLAFFHVFRVSRSSSSPESSVSSDSVYSQVRASLRSSPQTWLVTGAAGFIGLHLVENLLGVHQHVVGLNYLST